MEPDNILEATVSGMVVGKLEKIDDVPAISVMEKGGLSDCHVF